MTAELLRNIVLLVTAAVFSTSLCYALYICFRAKPLHEVYKEHFMKELNLIIQAYHVPIIKYYEAHNKKRIKHDRH